MDGTTSSPPGPEAVPGPKPLFRGRVHQIFLILAIPAVIRLVIAAPSTPSRLAMVVYGLSLIGLFGASAAYHLGRWSPTALRRARSLDHTMIFILIAGTHTAFAALVLDGAWRIFILTIVWTGAVVGITLKLVKPEGFSRTEGTLFIVLGWIGVAAIPKIISDAQILPFALIAVGGLLYTFGAVVLFRRWPDPSPRVFGYHEVWHAMVAGASACHYIAITALMARAI